jgi:DNA-binding IclR family transcriptional regulator
MPGDSVSTFIDVTQAGSRRAPPRAQDPTLASRARVLATLSDGVTRVDDLVKETQLPEDTARTAIDWLSENGLVEVRPDASGVERLALTLDASDALDGS